MLAAAFRCVNQFDSPEHVGTMVAINGLRDGWERGAMNDVEGA